MAVGTSPPGTKPLAAGRPVPPPPADQPQGGGASSRDAFGHEEGIVCRIGGTTAGHAVADETTGYRLRANAATGQLRRTSPPWTGPHGLSWEIVVGVSRCG